VAGTAGYEIAAQETVGTGDEHAHVSHRNPRWRGRVDELMWSRQAPGSCKFLPGIAAHIIRAHAFS
jgi:hypothetical protein